MTWFEPFVAEELGSVQNQSQYNFQDHQTMRSAYRNEMPYCDTASKPDFQTKVTSQALVAWSRQDKKAETALPPTIR